MSSQQHLHILLLSFALPILCFSKVIVSLILIMKFSSKTSYKAKDGSIGGNAISNVPFSKLDLNFNYKMDKNMDKN